MSEFVKVASTDEVGPGSYKTKERSGSSTGSFCKQSNATHTVLREFCGIEFSNNPELTSSSPYQNRN